MSDWDDACDPVQPVREREERRSNKARAHWQRLRQAKGDVAGKITSLQGHSTAVDYDFDERF